MRDQSPLPERRQVMTEVQLSCLVISFLCERFSAGTLPIALALAARRSGLGRIGGWL